MSKDLGHKMADYAMKYTIHRQEHCKSIQRLNDVPPQYMGALLSAFEAGAVFALSHELSKTRGMKDE